MIDTINHGAAVRELRLNRPPVNALSDELIRSLHQALKLAAQDGVRALVLSAARADFPVASMFLYCLPSIVRE